MNVKIQSVKFDADKRLVDFIQAKMDKMDPFRRACDRGSGYAAYRQGRRAGQQGGYRQDRRRRETELLAERRCKTFEEAIDLCLDAIKKQIDKYKEKRR